MAFELNKSRIPVAGTDPKSCACGFSPGTWAEIVSFRNVNLGVRSLKMSVLLLWLGGFQGLGFSELHVPFHTFVRNVCHPGVCRACGRNFGLMCFEIQVWSHIAHVGIFDNSSHSLKYNKTYLYITVWRLRWQNTLTPLVTAKGLYINSINPKGPKLETNVRKLVNGYTKCGMSVQLIPNYTQ